jgi:hypothetical protein
MKNANVVIGGDVLGPVLLAMMLKGFEIKSEDNSNPSPLAIQAHKYVSKMPKSGSATETESGELRFSFDLNTKIATMTHRQAGYNIQIPLDTVEKIDLSKSKDVIDDLKLLFITEAKTLQNRNEVFEAWQNSTEGKAAIAKKETEDLAKAKAKA